MLDIITPSCISDVYRLKVLIASLNKFWHIRGTFFIIVPKRDYVAFKEIIKDKRVEIVDENSLIPYVDKVPLSGWRPTWYRQQVVKLSAWRLPASSNFLVLDADCFLRREVEETELVVDGKAAVNLTDGKGSWWEWYKISAQILGTAVPKKQIPVTPVVLSTYACEALEERVREIANYDRPWIWLLGRWGWTEYTLYHCWAEHSGIWDAYHYTTDFSLTEACVWGACDVPNFHANVLFETKEKAPFSLIQSTIKVPDEWIWAELKPFLK